MNERDTIVAIATAPGRGAIDIVRLSGARAVAIADSFLTPKPSRKPPQRIYLANAELGLLDHLTVIRYEAPASYTGDDAVELFCHGGGVIARRLVELAVKAGARPAAAGEFTRRAWEAGKLDLLQAEAVGKIADATSLSGVRILERQLSGALSEQLKERRRELLTLSARLEAELSYPEESLTINRSELESQLANLTGELERLLSTADFARTAISGAVVVLAGAENVGKSSLFNALLGAEAALVTNLPGTTRDALSGRLQLGELTATLYDTAGRPEQWRDELTALAADRAERAATSADRLLLVIDASSPHPPAWAVDEVAATPTLLLANKTDLIGRELALERGREIAAHFGLSESQVLAVSAQNGSGLDQLRERLSSGLIPPESDLALTSVRQQEGIAKAVEALERAEEQLRRDGWDIASVELMNARRSLEEVLGVVTDEAVLDTLFSSFCVGK